MRKIFSKILACVLSFGLSFGTVGCDGDKNTGETGTPIDMYLIGGQSNAVGYTYHRLMLEDVYSNVGYAGDSDRSCQSGLSDGQSNVSSFGEFYWEVKAGYGMAKNCVGLEYGMAQALNGQYQGETKAFIFKSAGGGTALADVYHEYGNWYPVSLWEEGYSPVEEQWSTGWQYYWFVENFRTVYTELKNNGYNPQIKGMAWMQGESDLENRGRYASLLKTLINDLRDDLAEITGSKSLKKMPFVIGKIATSWNGWANPLVPPFNAAQEEVAKESENVLTVETADLIIVNEDGSINGSNQHHFNWKDMETLGIRFGEKLLEMNEK